MKHFTIPVLLLFASGSLAAQQKSIESAVLREQPAISGNLAIDLFGEQRFIDDSLSNLKLKEMPGYKSPLKAALFSAILPGAGQTYAERYWQGLSFFGAEVGLWVVYAVYESRANHQTADFQTYADQHWSAVRYADWITQYASQLAPNVDVNTSGLVPNRNPNLPPWEQVDWQQINLAEDQIMMVTGNGFTHNLPTRPAQQYYELIGKYWQFLGGWDDAGGRGPADVVAANVSPEFLAYSRQRGDANSLYAIASTATYVLVANHVLSALEAAWSAAVDNSRLKMGATLEPRRQADGIVEFVPTAHLELEF
jgi:hypothetical protein